MSIIYEILRKQYKRSFDIPIIKAIFQKEKSYKKILTGF